MGPNTILRIENESPVDLNPQLYGHEARTLLLCYNHCTSEGSQLGAFHLNIGKFCFLVYFSTILFFGEANPRNFVGSNLIELNYNLDFLQCVVDVFNLNYFSAFFVLHTNGV